MYVQPILDIIYSGYFDNENFLKYNSLFKTLGENLKFFNDFIFEQNDYIFGT